MTESLQEILKRKAVKVSFERRLGLVGATTLGVGALMGAGIYVLVGLAADQTGPSVWIAYLLCGFLTLPSVLMFGELSRRVPAAGGGYIYAYQGLGSFGGFVTGWLLAWGSIFACAMYSLGFAYYVSPLIGLDLPEYAMRVMGAVIAAALTLLNCVGTRGGDRAQRIFTWGNLLVLLLLVVSGVPEADTGRLLPLFPKGFEGMLGALAIIYISFFGYQLVANNAEEIVEAERTIPKAMLLSMLISMIFYVAVALVAVLVVPWGNLAASQTPLVDVATRSLGTVGWRVIAFGGVLASAAALNSTLLSQGRQIYAMGSHSLLPSLLGKIHEARKTPQAALITGGLMTVVTVTVGDLEFIVKTANFCFIVSLLPVAFALRKLQSSPEQQCASGWKKGLPVVAFLSNLALLMTIDWVAFAFGMQLLTAGLAVYLVYSRKREIRSRIGMSFVLMEEEESLLRRGSRILVPMANPQTQGAIFSISQTLLARQGGEIIVLSVLTAPEQMDFHSALADAQDSVKILEDSAKMSRSKNVRLRPVMRVSRSLAKGIIHAAEEEKCNLVVMGYGAGGSPDSTSVMEEVLADARTDVIFFKRKTEFPPSQIAVSLGSRTNLNLIVRLAGALADQFEGHITFLNVLPTEYSADQKAATDRILIEAIQKHGGKSLYRTEVLSSEDPVESLVERSKDFDLLIAGTSKVGFLERAVVGSFATQLVERSQCSVALVRVIPQSQRVLAPLV